MARRPPSRVTSRRPLRVWKQTLSLAGCSRVRTRWPVARVAWPQSSTSATGVNQRRSKSPSSLGTKKAVSDRLFSAAMACMRSSSSQLSRGQTAAGLPAKTESVKASI